MNKIPAYIIILVLLIAIVFAAKTLTSKYPWTDEEDLGWYDVEDWERAVCASYGPQSPGNPDNPGSADSNFPYISEIAARIQGEKLVFLNETLYNIEWYVQPIHSSVGYNVVLVKENGEKEDFTGALSAGVMDTGMLQKPFYSNENFTHAILTLTDDNHQMKVKIIEKKVRK